MTRGSRGVWSKEPPTKPGWYWAWYESDNDTRQPCEVREGLDGVLEVYTIGGVGPFFLQHFDLWGPRLRPPPPPSGDES